MSEPRHHHFVPAFYLCHFAIPHHRYKGRLYGYDRMTARKFGGSPDSFGHERDFNRIEVAGDTNDKDANTVERALAKIEKRFAKAVTGVNERGTLPSDPVEMGDLLAFVACQATRTPRVRRLFEKFYNDTGKLILQALADDRGAFEEEFREPGMTEVEVEQLYELHRKVAYANDTRVTMDQTTLVLDALELSPEILSVLVRRHWILGVAQDDATFITTDDPVCLLPASMRRMPPLWSPGFDDPNTNVLVPIGPRLLLMGLPRPIDRARLRISPRDVAATNTDLALRAHRFIYFTGPTFFHLTTDRELVVGPTEVLRASDPEPSVFDVFGPA